MGAQDVVKIFDEIIKDKSIKAVVLRIDSGGWSALGSDIIHHGVERLKEKDIPVVVSVGNVAASGGYYIACHADRIISNPSSIVGSIGVITGKFVVKGLFDKLGIRKEVFKRGKNSDIYSMYTKPDESQHRQVQKRLQEIYDLFVDKVARGRDMSTEDVDALGQGRVYTANRGVELGLIDDIGGLYNAIDDAKRLAGYSKDEVLVVTYPKLFSFYRSFIFRESYSFLKNPLDGLSYGAYYLYPYYFLFR